MKKNYHISIIGSGLTGMSTALALASLNYKVALIDPKALIFSKKVYPDDRTTAISSGSVDFYKKIGVWKYLKKYSCPIKKILVEELSSELYTTFASDLKKGKAMGYMIENKNFIKTLIQLTKSNEHITKYDNRLIHLSRRGNAVLTTLDNNIMLQSKLVIGADGRKSYTRKLAKIPYKFKDYKQKAFTFNIEHEKTHNNLAIEKFLEEGPLAVLPINRKNNKNLSSVVWSCNYPDYYKYQSKGKKKIETLIQNYFKKIYGKIRICTEIKAWDLSLTHSKNYIDERILLLGDSAHSIHPLAGQGFNLTIRGIKKIYNFAETEIKKSKDIGRKQYLFNYSKKHYLDASLLILVTDRLNLLFSNSNFLYRSLRRKGLLFFSKSNFARNIFKNYATKGSLLSFKSD
ncbi:FAD-dependent monooxygenase [Alphaproteobacteria bacterium]|nr:FAD-dependent monooxygenase [Alphaproteobacteria bacterium]